MTFEELKKLYSEISIYCEQVTWTYQNNGHEIIYRFWNNPVGVEKEQSSIIISDPDVMGGTPIFAGTRVPFQTLIDYLKGGESIEDFLAGFLTVSREQVIAFLKQEPNEIVMK
jgi:uncharacterized protein (DUF433 family)